MTVYVDNYQKMGEMPGRGTVFWSHLIADTPDELAAFAERFADRIDLVRRCDEAKCTYRDIVHFDVPESVRQEALATCGAEYITFSQFGEIVKARRAAARRAGPAAVQAGDPTPERTGTAGGGPRYNPETARHSWLKPKIHHRECRHCGLHVVNESSNDVTWWQTWKWPNGAEGTNKDAGTTRLPKCPGPPKEATAGAA